MPDAEREQVVHARLEAARRIQLLEELLHPAPQRDLRADSEPIGSCTLEPYLQVMVLRERPRVVPIDERLLVDVVHDQIERAVAIQVAVGRAARKAQRVQSPGRALVREGQVAPVMEGEVRQLGRAHRIHQPPEVHASPARGLDHGLPARQKRDVVLGGDVLGEAGGDVDVLVAVQVEIGQQHAPAPVRPGHTGHLADVRESAVAVVEVEHVARKLIIKPVPHVGLETVPALERGSRLEAMLVVRQHVRDVDVRPTVVVHVPNVETHRRQADVG